MGKLIYSMITSLDGFVSDPDGDFGWGAPEEESHTFISFRAMCASISNCWTSDASATAWSICVMASKTMRGDGHPGWIIGKSLVGQGAASFAAP